MEKNSALDISECQSALEQHNQFLRKIENSGNEEEIDTANKQSVMGGILLEYFQDGSKDPKKAYKALQDIDNGEQIDETTDINFLLEYNCGVFAYLSQMYDNAFDHFVKILKYNEDAELFLVIKSAFICLQILVDNQQVESSKIMIQKLEELQPCLEKLASLK